MIFFILSASGLTPSPRNVVMESSVCVRNHRLYVRDYGLPCSLLGSTHLGSLLFSLNSNGFPL